MQGQTIVLADLHVELEERTRTLGTSSDNGRNRVPREGPPTCWPVSCVYTWGDHCVTDQDHGLGGGLVGVFPHWHLEHD